MNIYIYVIHNIYVNTQIDRIVCVWSYAVDMFFNMYYDYSYAAKHCARGAAECVLFSCECVIYIYTYTIYIHCPCIYTMYITYSQLVYYIFTAECVLFSCEYVIHMVYIRRQCIYI